MPVAKRSPYIGKPNRYVLEIALLIAWGWGKETRFLQQETGFNTDIVGAKNVGLKAALVKAGEFQENDLK